MGSVNSTNLGELGSRTDESTAIAVSATDALNLNKDRRVKGKLPILRLRPDEADSAPAFPSYQMQL
jgi:hypothetical protein